ncbi:MAG: DUF2845 domain-containing protein [Methylococcaceae bacterium]|nr:DUF2845 domain-containing protein [Methylococcaceae bacterium]
MNRSKIFLLILTVTFSSASYALRCGHYLVGPGDYKDDVLEKCGPPDSAQSHYETRGRGNRAQINQFNFNQNHINQFNFNQYPNLSYEQGNYHEVEVLVEEWKYDFTRGRLRKLLRFENGELKEIIDLGKYR